jgi:hypothetical protein
MVLFVTTSEEELSTQQIYGRTRQGGVYMKPEGKATKEAYQYEAKSQWRDKPTGSAARYFSRVLLGARAPSRPRQRQ